ncbi:MAG: hypothetical protein ACFFCS_14810 [Candidatus Hodarchaeota archaeon]
MKVTHLQYLPDGKYKEALQTTLKGAIVSAKEEAEIIINRVKKEMNIIFKIGIMWLEKGLIKDTVDQMDYCAATALMIYKEPEKEKEIIRERMPGFAKLDRIHVSNNSPASREWRDFKTRSISVTVEYMLMLIDAQKDHFDETGNFLSHNELVKIIYPTYEDFMKYLTITFDMSQEQIDLIRKHNLLNNIISDVLKKSRDIAVDYGKQVAKTLYGIK